MHLVDHEIESLLEKCNDLIKPFEADQLSVDTYDLRLSNEFVIPKDLELANDSYDMKSDNTNNWRKVVLHDIDDEFTVEKHGFILASTVERITLPSGVSATLEGKSSVAREGLMIHAAGHIESGFSGNLTLEIKNLRDVPFKLYPGQLIAQIKFFFVSEPLRLYNTNSNHYQNQTGVTLGVGGKSRNIFKKIKDKSYPTKPQS